jgi:hypothetical protein
MDPLSRRPPNFGSALMTSRTNPLAQGSFVPQRVSVLDVYGPPKVRQPVDLSKSAGKPSGLVAEFRSIQKVPRMDNDRPTYHIIKTNNSIPGRESVQGLLYSGDDDDRFPGVAA